MSGIESHTENGVRGAIAGFVLDSTSIQGVFKSQKLSFQGVFIRRLLCHT